MLDVVLMRGISVLVIAVRCSSYCRVFVALLRISTCKKLALLSDQLSRLLLKNTLSFKMRLAVFGTICCSHQKLTAMIMFVLANFDNIVQFRLYRHLLDINSCIPFELR